MNTLVTAKPETRNPKPDIVCREVYGKDELEDCYRIRKQVFVEEQNLFTGTDRDRYDKGAIHIAAWQGGRIIGTVRIYEKGRGTWYGGRLAVLKGFRGRAGRLLIEKAIETARAKNAERFLAYIQARNVPFFKCCGWSKAGEAFNYHGVPHLLMEADLTKGFKG